MEEYLTTPDGHRFAIEIYKHEEDEDRPVIVCTPAMGTSSAYYEKLGQALYEKGFHVILSEQRGLKKSSVRSFRGHTFGYREMVDYDWPELMNYVKKNFRKNKIFLLGHSLGGQLNALYASKHPDEVQGLIFIAAGSVYFQSYPFPYNIRAIIATQSFYVISSFFGYFPGKKIGFGGNESKYVMRDWAHQARTGKYELKDSNDDYEALLSSFEKPVLAISIDGDMLAPQGTVDHLCSKMEKAPITKWQYKMNYSKKGDPHFVWAKEPFEIVSQIPKWLETF